jgi:hypothetical protein
MGDICSPAGKKVINTEDFVPLFQKSFAQMRAEKTGSAGDENSFAHDVPP